MNINSHSPIIDYPINYDLFPKMKDVKFMEFTLNENEFLLIPFYWLHMVVTEPFTFALFFEISKMKRDESSILHNNFKNNIFLMNSTRAFVWCMNCHIWKKYIFCLFFSKGGTLT